MYSSLVQIVTTGLLYLIWNRKVVEVQIYLICICMEVPMFGVSSSESIIHLEVCEIVSQLLISLLSLFDLFEKHVFST